MYLNPAWGYELSLYDKTPLVVWLSLLCCFIVSIVVILRIVQQDVKTYTVFYIGACIVLLLHFRLVLLNIPSIRGYYSLLGDHLTHTGLIKDISQYGHPFEGNYYPLAHILVSEISQILDIPIEPIQNVIPSLYSIFLFASLYLLSTTIFTEQKLKYILVITSAGALFSAYHVYFMPNGLSFLFLPFCLYLFLKGMVIPKYVPLLLIVLISYPFYHMLGSLVLIFTLVMVGGTYYFLSKTVDSIMCGKIARILISSVLIEFVAITYWIFHFDYFNYNIEHFIKAVFEWNEGTIEIQDMQNKLGMLGLDGTDFFELFLFSKGAVSIYLCFLVIATILLTMQYRRHDAATVNKPLVGIIVLIYSCGILYAAHLFGIVPGLGNLSASRLLNYAGFYLPIPAALVVGYVLN